jgi:esterase/lipase
MLRRNFSLTNLDSEIIRAEIHHREDVKNAPVIIICHGFKGFKDWAFFPFLAESLADAGYIALTFNFSRSGIGADLYNFTELDLFAKNTFTHELKDLQCIIDTLVAGEIGKGLVDPERIGLIGHSRGGGVAILYTHSDQRIKSLVTWSAIANVERYSAEEIVQWKRKGYIEIENKRTNQIMRVSTDLLDDIQKNKKKLNILSAAEKIDIPTLVIHGQEDETVPVNEAQMIYDHLNASDKDLMIIEEGSHTYNAMHPLESIPEELETVLYLTESWFDKFL